MALFSQLGSQIIEAKTTLDRALDLSKSLQTNIPLLNNYIDNIEVNLSKNGDAHTDKQFIKVIL